MDQAAENIIDTTTVNLNAALETLTEEGTATPTSKENSTNIMPDKRRRSTKDKTENENSKTTNVDAKNVSDVSAPNRKNLKRKAKQPPTAEMIMDSITNRRLRNGATFEEICNYMENKYSVNMKVLKPQIHNFLKESADKGVLDKSDGAGGELKFKIKKSVNKKENATPIIKKNNNNIEHGKQAINIKDKTENKKPKITNVDAKIINVAPAPERKNLKRKAEHPPTSEMVMESIKALRKYKGATFEDITKHMEEKYSVNMKVLKSHVNKFLKKSVDNGVLDKIDAAGGEEKFKIKKSEDRKKSAKVLPGKEVKGKPTKKIGATKKQVKK